MLPRPGAAALGGHVNSARQNNDRHSTSLPEDER
jgi:hypothetical protein